MRGMSAKTGKAIAGIAHIQQSVRDILTTPIGSRVMLRHYGSELPELIDQPDNGATRVRLFAATAAALAKWEPRLKIDSVQLFSDADNTPGKRILEITGQTNTADDVVLNIPIGGTS